MNKHHLRVCRLVASAALLTLSLLTLSLVPTLGSLPAASVPAATDTATNLTVSLSSITPTFAVPQAPVTITGTVRNSGSSPLTEPVARVMIRGRALTTREAVAQWSSSTEDDEQLAEVTRISVGAALAPGALTRFAVTIPATAIPHGPSFAVLPLRVDVIGTKTDGSQERGSQRTFLPALGDVKQYEPLSIAWLVPLTLDPDPALHGVDSAERTEAWTRAIGPDSRLEGLIKGTEASNVTWAIDPAILGPPPVPGGTPTSTPTSTPTPTATPSPTSATATPDGGSPTTPDEVTAATTALASRLRAAAPRHTLWSLPYADPDLAALLPLASGSSALREATSRPSTLTSSVGSARTDIAWPVDGTLTPEREQQLRGAYSSPSLAATVVSAASLSTASGQTDNAGRRSSQGLPLLAYDEGLSRTFTQTSSSTSGALTIQRFLADSMALLGERPGAQDRSVLVAAPRTFAGNPEVLTSLFASIANAPWLTPATTDQLLSAGSEATPEPAGSGGTATPSPTPTPTATPTASATAVNPLSISDSPLTSGVVGAIPGTMSAISGIASIRDDAQLFQVRWSDAQHQLLSARWRGHPDGLAAIDAATTAAITSVSRGVRVAPSSVNFFADRGILQVTVVNDLDVPVHDVRLTLTPAQPRLRIDQQPGPLKIGANSRTNVPLEVIAIAAGMVPVEAVLSTANGTPLGQDARLEVRVHPTDTWLYWVLGGLAGVILVLGTYRAVRRPSTRASRVAAQEIPIDG